MKVAGGESNLARRCLPKEDYPLIFSTTHFPRNFTGVRLCACKFLGMGVGPRRTLSESPICTVNQNPDGFWQSGGPRTIPSP